MTRLILVALTIGGIWLPSMNTAADERRAYPVKHVRQVCHSGRCGPYTPCGISCRRVCPSPYSCYSLYGAYGPYGGHGFWGAYTYSGWQ